MADANAIVVANAVVAELNATTRGWSGKFKAARGYLPVYRLEDLKDLTVTVVSFSRLPLDPETRRPKSIWEYVVHVDFQQSAVGLGLPELDALVNLIDRDITDFFADYHYLAGTSNVWWIARVAMVADDVYWFDKLYQEGIFQATIALTVKGLI